LTAFQPILHQLLAERDIMSSEAASAHLRYILEQNSEKARKPKSAVLFRRGDKASGMFVVLSGRVSLDLGVDSLLARSYGAGALVGLPSTITRQNYSMTATVTEDAELAYLSPDGLESLLHTHPDLCQPLLVILGEKIAESREDEKSLLEQVSSPSNS
jgi:CRP-like cAMP-binding protein